MGDRRLEVVVVGIALNMLIMLIMLIMACGGPPPASDEVGDEVSESSTEGTSDSTEGFDESTTSWEGEDGCGSFEILYTIHDPSNTMLLVDTSSSMAQTWDDDDDPLTPEVTRWSSARAFIEGLITELDSDLNFGLQRFPSAAACPDASLESSNCSDADVCPIEGAPEVPVGTNQGAAILAALPPADADATEIVGGSPASAAFLAARDAMPEPTEYQLANRFVLITDGGANCGMGLNLPDSFEIWDDSLAMHVGDALEDDVYTVVVGIDVDTPFDPIAEDSPPVDTATALDAIAAAGGSGQAFELHELPYLIDALFFSEGAITCAFDLTTSPAGAPEPEQIPLVTVEMDGEPLPLVEDCATEDGWSWIVEGEILTLCGSACEHATTANRTLIEVVYGCPPI